MTAALRIPHPRRGGVWRFLRGAWTAPTTLLGRAVARAAGCSAPNRVGAPGAPAHLYTLPEGRLRGLGAVALGHVVLVEPGFFADRPAWLLAHELSHTRQHDWLGPAYLPVHGVFQLVSVILNARRPVPGFTPQHAYNPLERRWLCVPFDALIAEERPTGPVAARVLAAFGLEDR